MIRLFEEFKKTTLDKNISTYNDYYNTHKDGSRSNIVAWEADDSQIKNFKLVSKFIKNGDSVLDFGCGIGDFLMYLDESKINISDYMGVDINDNFISLAKETYSNNKFQHIKDIDNIKGKWDDVCVIGVFTWYIERDEFIETIYKLRDLANKQVLLTCLHDMYVDDDEDYWESTYRYYNEEFFEKLFPDLKFEFDYSPRGDTMLVRIIK